MIGFLRRISNGTINGYMASYEMLTLLHVNVGQTIISYV